MLIHLHSAHFQAYGHSGEKQNTRTGGRLFSPGFIFRPKKYVSQKFIRSLHDCFLPRERTCSMFLLIFFSSQWMSGPLQALWPMGIGNFSKSVHTCSGFFGPRISDSLRFLTAKNWISGKCFRTIYSLIVNACVRHRLLRASYAEICFAELYFTFCGGGGYFYRI